MTPRNLFAATVLIVVLLAGILLCRTAASAASIEVPRISIERTKQMLANPEVVIIDVRTAKTWWRSPSKIENAVREELGSLERWAEKYPKNTTLIFFFFLKKERTSARSARHFIKKGYPNVYALKGGWYAWKKAGYPVEKK